MTESKLKESSVEKRSNQTTANQMKGTEALNPRMESHGGAMTLIRRRVHVRGSMSQKRQGVSGVLCNHTCSGLGMQLYASVSMELAQTEKVDRQTDRQADRMTTVTLAAHAHAEG